MKKLMIILAISLGSQAVAQQIPNALQSIDFDTLAVKTVDPIVFKELNPYEATFMKAYGEDKVEEVFELLDKTTDRGVQFGINLSEETLYSYRIRKEDFEGTVIVNSEESSIQVINSSIQ